MTMHSPEERAAFKQFREIADTLEKIDDKLSGIINVLDQLDTNLGHHLADIANEIKEA